MLFWLVASIALIYLACRGFSALFYWADWNDGFCHRCEDQRWEYQNIDAKGRRVYECLKCGQIVRAK